MQFVQHFEMIKNEKSENDLLDAKIMYEDLSAKKQKLDQQLRSLSVIIISNISLAQDSHPIYETSKFINKRKSEIQFKKSLLLRIVFFELSGDSKFDLIDNTLGNSTM